MDVAVGHLVHRGDQRAGADRDAVAWASPRSGPRRPRSPSPGWDPGILGWDLGILGWGPGILGWGPEILGWGPGILGWDLGILGWVAEIPESLHLATEGPCCRPKVADWTARKMGSAVLKSFSGHDS